MRIYLEAGEWVGSLAYSMTLDAHLDRVVTIARVLPLSVSLQVMDFSVVIWADRAPSSESAKLDDDLFATINRPQIPGAPHHLVSMSLQSPRQPSSILWYRAMIAVYRQRGTLGLRSLSDCIIPPHVSHRLPSDRPLTRLRQPKLCLALVLIWELLLTVTSSTNVCFGA